MERFLGILLCVTFLIAGCGGEPELSPEAKAKKEARKAAQEAYAAKQVQKEKENQKTPGSHGQQAVKTEEARGGVGAKGHYGDEPMMQPITQAMSLYWGVQEKQLFEWQIIPALKNYKTINGYYPGEEAMRKAEKDDKSKTEIEAICQAAFEKEILEPLHLNMKKLPELPAGKEYYYDASKGKLMVRTFE